MTLQPNATLPAVVDLIVLGGGLAGHSAALEGAAAGKSVLLLEKTGQYGGSTVLSSGSFAFADTAAQREKGIQDTDELLRADIQKASGGRVVPALAELYVEEQRDCYAWLLQQGVEFHPIALSSNQGVPRTHPTDPWQLMRALHARLRENPRIQYVDNLSASGLDTDAGGTVTGVLTAEGRKVEARLGVVLATGGFSRDRELIDKFCPRLANALVLGGEGNTGDGLKMAWKLGADLLDMPFITGTFGVSLNNYPRTTIDAGQEPRLTLSIYKGGIAVNKKAERFADESISYKVLGEICLQQPDGVGFQVWDQKIMDQSAPQPTSNDLEEAYRKGLVHKAEDIASLAKLVGLDPERLQQTVARYNEDVAAGADTVFGRTGLGRGWGKLVAIDTAPFYIYPCSTGVVATYCGLKVDAGMRVIDVRGAAIPRLLAAGEIVGGFHGSGYMSGSSLSKSVIFGRVAARTAVEQA